MKVKKQQTSVLAWAVFCALALVLASCTLSVEDDYLNGKKSVEPEETKDTVVSPVIISLGSKPKEMYLSADGRQLLLGGRNFTGLYDSAVIRDVYLTFPQSNFWSILQSNYAINSELEATLTLDGKTYTGVGVRFKGQTSYQTAIKTSKKISFNISMQYVTANQKLMGYKTLNLNNAFEDASFLREVFYYHQIRQHVPAAKANFVHLYINNEDWGIYPNLQQLNKDFLEEWFFSNDGGNWRAEAPGSTGMPGPGGGWGSGKSGLNYLGDAVSLYQTNYTLKSSDITNHWEKLAAACKALNTTPSASMTDVIPNFFDVDRVLWFLASEIAFTDEDSYVWKGQMDYYVYYEPETGRITPVEYDGNSVMKANYLNWSPFYNELKVNYPLLNKLLSVPQYRQRYLAHLRTIIANQMNVTVCNRILENYKKQINSLVQSDPKKLYTYTQFNSEVEVLKNFISSRVNILLSNAEVSQIAPVIGQVDYKNSVGQKWTTPAANTPVIVTAGVTSANGVGKVNLYYATTLTGNFTAVAMADDGKQGDGIAGDRVYGATIPAQPALTYIRFYIEAVAGNQASTVAYKPVGAEHDVFFLQMATN